MTCFTLAQLGFRPPRLARRAYFGDARAVPCDIGYRSVARAELRTAPPEVDAELLARLGIDDPAFVDWLTALDTGPLLERALERTLAAQFFRSQSAPGRFSIENGMLKSETDTPEIGALVAKRWQMEVLRLVCELLDYDVTIEERGGAIVIEGEKTTHSGDHHVHEYIAITSDKAGGADVRFEHFSSDEALATEQARFFALAQKLSLRARLTGEKRAGQKIPPGTRHPHKHKGKA
jgi:hypothetical protein